MDVSKLSMLACNIYPVIIWNSLLSIFKLGNSDGSLCRRTSNHLNIIGNKTDFILNLKARMTSLFKAQVSLTWKVDKNVLDNGRPEELYLVLEPPA